MQRMLIRICVAVALILLLASPSSALLRDGNRWPINLGITGALGDLKPDAPTVIVVVDVRPETPAAGLLEVGDRIVGVNGTPFTTPHRFGYGMDKFGYEGPLMEFGNALEESQGDELGGRLTLDVVRDGVEETVELQLPTTYGQFADTYPENCDKTDIILAELYEYLVDRQRPDGAWHGRPHFNMFAALALLASGDEQYLPNVRRAMEFMAAETNDELDYRGYDCWKHGLYGVALGEYYLATEEEWVLEELDEINRWLVKAQFTKPYRDGRGTGGWGHRPANRPEGNGYGPICMITAQAMAAWSMIGQCGLEIDESRHKLAHDFLVGGTNNIGYVWYADGNGGDDKYADMGRTGGAAVAHAVSPLGGEEYREYALECARCIGTNYNTFFDTHGSAILGMGWTALGAATDPESFRNLMDQHVWFFNLSHCPDGTFYFMPNRDPNDQDYNAGKYLSATAATALILSLRNNSLRMIQGSE